MRQKNMTSVQKNMMAATKSQVSKMMIMQGLQGLQVLKGLAEKIRPEIEDNGYSSDDAFLAGAATKKQRLPIYLIDLLLFCANHKTGEDRVFFFSSI